MPLTSPDGRALSGRGFSFRVPHGPWVLILVERLFGDLPGDVGGGDWLGNHVEGVWVAQPEASAVEVDYTEGFAQCAPCSEPLRRPGVRFPRLRYEPFAPGLVLHPSGAADVDATLQRLKEAFPAAPPPRKAVCAFCRATGRMKLCSACKATQYCDAECQRLGWPQHKAACKAAAARLPAVRRPRLRRRCGAVRGARAPAGRPSRGSTRWCRCGPACGGAATA